VETASPTLFADVQLAPGATLRFPRVPEGAAFVVAGRCACEGTVHDAGTLLLFEPGSTPVLEGDTEARLLLLGGAPLDGPRFIWWNFVSSSKERIVEAARAWRQGTFPKVPGDEVEFVPLDKEPAFAASERGH
jgi:redox-sensitive bicupin YhaK (pirin superfamily)